MRQDVGVLSLKDNIKDFKVQRSNFYIFYFLLTTDSTCFKLNTKLNEMKSASEMSKRS